MLSDGSRAALRAGRRGRAGAPRAGGHARGRDLPRAAGDPARPPRRDRPRLPHATGASPAATGSTAWPADGPVRPRALRGRAPRARSWRSPRRPSGWCRCRGAKLFAVGHFDSVAGAIAATDDALELERLGDRADGPHDPRPLARASSSSGGSAEHAGGRPRGAAVRELRRRHARPRRATSSTASRRPGAAHGHGYHTLRAETAAEQDALTKVRKVGLGLLMAASTGARRPLAFVEDTAVAPERLDDYVARFKRDPRPPRADRRLLRPLLGRLPAHPPVRRPHRARRDRDDAAPWPRRSLDLVAEFDGVNSSEHGDGRVRSGVQPRGSSATTSTRRCASVKRAVRPARAAEPRA